VDGEGTGGAGATREVGFWFTGVEPDGSVVAIEGVELCEADTDNCAMSNELGTAVIEVPYNQEIAFTAEKEGYGKWITADVTNDDAERITSRRLYTDAQLEEVSQQLGIPYPWTDGVVGLVRFPAVAEGGVTFAPIGPTASEVGDEFYYDGETDAYSVDLTATSAYDGLGYLLPLGDGGFAEVIPGEQVFELGGTGGDCPVSWGWPGDTPSQMRLPVKAGYRTYGGWNCNLLE
jgi:hypothetical protein